MAGFFKVKYSRVASQLNCETTILVSVKKTDVKSFVFDLNVIGLPHTHLKFPNLWLISRSSPVYPYRLDWLYSVQSPRVFSVRSL